MNCSPVTFNELVLQIKSYPNSCQYPLINYLGANAASSGSSLSCFGALFSVFRAATDYCRYGNLRQYLLIDPTTGEPKKVGFLTYVRFILYSKCSISKLFSNFCCLFTFCYLDGANSIKTGLRTCNLWTGQSVI